MDWRSERGQILIEMILMAFFFAALLAFFQVRASQNIEKFKSHKFSQSKG